MTARELFRFALAMVLLTLSACQQRQLSPNEPKAEHEVATKVATKATRVPISEGREGIGDAILTPAQDLNLKRASIPPLLLALEQVYSLDRQLSCEEIAAELTDLDAVLGPDLDNLQGDQDSISSQASEATVAAVAGITGGVIPFRGLVRRATGATAHEKKIREAYLAGLKRRAYLKGLAQGLVCQALVSGEVD